MFNGKLEFISDEVRGSTFVFNMDLEVDDHSYQDGKPINQSIPSNRSGYF